MRWISVNSNLPEMFKNVLVKGIVNTITMFPHVYEARRFSGSNQPVRYWEWLTPTDHHVLEVEFWMDIPELKESINREQITEDLYESYQTTLQLKNDANTLKEDLLRLYDRMRDRGGK